MLVHIINFGNKSFRWDNASGGKSVIYSATALSTKWAKTYEDASYWIAPDTSWYNPSNLIYTTRYVYDIPSSSNYAYPTNYSRETIPSYFYGLYQYTANNQYELVPTQLTATSNFVTTANFLGQNGIEVGNLQNASITSINELREKIQVYNALSILELNENITNASNMFDSCTNLTIIPKFNTNNIVNMSDMFYSCHNLVSIPYFNTSNVTNMSGMFLGCNNLTSIPNFDTSSVTDMRSMFSSCTNLTSVPNFDTSNVTSMHGMCHGCTNLLSVPNLDTHNVGDIRSMFGQCSNLTSTPEFNTSKVYAIDMMYSHCNNLTNASIQNIINMCLNSNVTGVYKNLSNTNQFSPLCDTIFDNSYYQDRLTELDAAGWAY